MSNTSRPVSESDLHAYVDGQLSAEEMEWVEAWIADHPEDRVKVQSWKLQNSDLKELFSKENISLPGDNAMLSRNGMSTPLRYFAAAIAATIIFSAGFLSAQLTPFAGGTNAQDAAFSSEASAAFLIYTAEVRHPVEVQASEKDHLVAWLGKRVGKSFPAPDLEQFGFDLIGGRLVPVDGNASALLMYENKAGKRLTVIVAPSGQSRDTAFQFVSDGPVETFFWIDEELRYAVSGEVSREILRSIADECYRQFQV